MANLGDVWHIPSQGEPRGRGGMRDPVGAIVPGVDVAVISGNQFQGGAGNPGNQLQIGSALIYKRSADQDWTEVPMTFMDQPFGNNKYYQAAIPSSAFNLADQVQYYLRIPYSDHDLTFVHGSDAQSLTTADEAVARANPFSFTVESSAVRGCWDKPIELPNVAVHASLLPNKKVLMWGRRMHVSDSADELDVHECQPFLLDTKTFTTVNTQTQPTDKNNAKINLFCSGHTLLPDGRLLVVGGHDSDGHGLTQACVYDPVQDTWTPKAAMSFGRWYPTAITLPSGGVLVASGSYQRGEHTVLNPIVEMWQEDAWTVLPDPFPENEPPQPGGQDPDFTPELYPRLHLTSAGLVFMSGPQFNTFLLDRSTGKWTATAGAASRVADRHLGQRPCSRWRSPAHLLEHP